MHPKANYSHDDIKKFEYLFGKDIEFPMERIKYFREKWSRLSDFMKDIDQTPYDAGY